MNESLRALLRAEELLEERQRRWTATKAERNQIAESLVHLEEHVFEARGLLATCLLEPCSRERIERAARLLQAPELLAHELPERGVTTPVSTPPALDRTALHREQVALMVDEARFDCQAFHWLVTRTTAAGAGSDSAFSRFWSTVTLTPLREQRARHELTRRTGCASLADALATRERLRQRRAEVAALLAASDRAERERADPDRGRGALVQRVCDEALVALTRVDLRHAHAELSEPERVAVARCHGVAEKIRLLGLLANAVDQRLVGLAAAAGAAAEAHRDLDQPRPARAAILRITTLEAEERHVRDELDAIQAVHHGIYEFAAWASYDAHLSGATTPSCMRFLHGSDPAALDLARAVFTG